MLWSTLASHADTEPWRLVGFDAGWLHFFRQQASDPEPRWLLWGPWRIRTPVLVNTQQGSGSLSGRPYPSDISIVYVGSFRPKDIILSSSLVTSFLLVLFINREPYASISTSRPFFSVLTLYCFVFTICLSVTHPLFWYRPLAPVMKPIVQNMPPASQEGFPSVVFWDFHHSDVISILSTAESILDVVFMLCEVV